MASHKSPSSQRWLDEQERIRLRRDRRDILATRRDRSTYRHSTEYIKTSAWLGDEATGRGYESAGHYHWRSLHKNLARPRLRTRRVKTVASEG